MNIMMICLEATEKILINKAYSEEVINEYLQKFEMTTEERALFMNIVEGVIVNLLSLEFYLNPYLSKKRYKSWVRPLLYIAIYKMLYLDEDEEEVILEVLEIARIKDRFLSSFIKVVLEKFKKNPLRSIDELDDLNRISIKYSYPVWLVAYLLKDHSLETVEEFLKIKPSKSLIVRVNYQKTTDEEVINILKEEKIKFEVLDDSLKGLLIYNISRNHYLLQDKLLFETNIKSLMIASIIKPKDDSIILDLFASISKFSINSSKLNNAITYSCDIEENNISNLKRQTKHLGNNVYYQLINPLKIAQKIKDKSCDYVIASVPSSGLGLINKKTDLKYHLNIPSLSGNIKYQEQIIANSINLVKNGGYYIYATDSINSDENEKQIEKLLSNNLNFEKVFDKQVLPSKSHSGFYICQLRRQYEDEVNL